MDEIELNIDAILGWKFFVRVNGRRYGTRPPSLADALVFEAMAGETDKERKIDQISAMGASLLIDPPEKLELPEWFAVILGVMDYWKLYVKNGSSIAASVTAAMANQTSNSESGSSTRP